MQKLLEQYSEGKIVLIFFILANAIYGLMIGLTIPEVMSYADGRPLLDMMPMGYEISYVTELFEALGVEGRRAYLTHQLPLDFFYPGLFGIAYSLLLAFFLIRLKKFQPSFIIICWVPLLAGLADYMENVGIIVLLITYPDLSEMNVGVTNCFSIVKSGSTTFTFLAILVCLIALLIKKFNTRVA